MRATMKVLVASLLVVAGLPAAALAADDGVILPAGSALQVRLQKTLTSKTNKTGDTFTGFVDKPLTVNGTTIVPVGSLVDGHVVFVKPSGRIKGVGEMRIVLDNVNMEDGNQFLLSGTLEDVQGSPCAKTGSDEEGTIKGCGKSGKDALKSAAIGGAMGAGAGATVAMGSQIDCAYFGNCGGPGYGSSLMYGAGIGAGAALIYHVFKNEKPLILIEGTHLTFVVHRSVKATPAPDTDNSSTNTN